MPLFLLLTKWPRQPRLNHHTGLFWFCYVYIIVTMQRKPRKLRLNLGGGHCRSLRDYLFEWNHWGLCNESALRCVVVARVNYKSIVLFVCSLVDNDEHRHCDYATHLIFFSFLSCFLSLKALFHKDRWPWNKNNILSFSWALPRRSNLRSLD